MSRRWSSLLGWGSFAFACAGTAAGVLIARGSDVYRPVEVRSSALDLFWAAAFLLLPGVGALIMSRKPGNKIGWILCGIGVAFGLGLFTGEYGKYAQVVPDSDLPGRALVSWFSISFRFAFLLPMLFLFLFPDGRPASRFWGWVVKAAVVVFALGFIAEVFMPGEIEGSAGISNPTGIEALRAPLEMSLVLTDGATAVLYLLAAAAPFVRYRRAAGDQRQQLKWVAYATFVFIALMASTILFDAFVPEISQGSAAVFTFLAFASLAGAVGVSILKHRLYDIDVVINRTLVYGALTLTLATFYLGSVLGFRSVLSPVTGDSDFAVAASTLLVATLFRPLRKILQAFMDRRFYRHKYDVATTVATFSNRVRDEIDLDDLSKELVETARTTMQPEHASLWLRVDEAW